MAKLKHHPAAFINAIAEEGTKEDAILLHLQQTWDHLMNLQSWPSMPSALRRLRSTR